MKDFISNFMGEHQKERDLLSYQVLLTTTAQKVVESLGERPFHIKRGLNAAAFDSVMVAFARGSQVPQDVRQRYGSLLQNAGFVAATTSGTTDVDTVRSRIRLADEILFQ